MPAGQRRSEPFSNVDAAWLHMERPTNMAMITGVSMFSAPIDYDRLRRTIERRFACFDRFRQRVKEPVLPLQGPQWEFDPHFDIDNHLHRISLPPPGDQAALQELVGQMMSIQLDFSKPLWEMHYVENFGQGSAMITRLHHCIADGLALVQVLLSMTDTRPDAPEPEPDEECPQERDLLSRLFAPAAAAGKAISRTWGFAETVVQEGLHTLVSPSRMVELARLAAGGTRALGKLLLIPPDQKTVLKGKCHVPKRAAWSAPIKLSDVKKVSKLMGGTVNDILLSALTGGLRRYLESRGEFVEGLSIRAIVPVNLRPPDDKEKLGNRFGLVFLSLPIGIRDPIKRLIKLKSNMNAIKNSPEAVVAFGILTTMGMTPTQIETIILKVFSMKGTAVMTNVPGPREKLYLAGQRLESLMFWVPTPGDLGVGVSIISYGGEVILGVAVDAGLVPYPESIIASFQDEFEYLKHWGRPERRKRLATGEAQARLEPGEIFISPPEPEQDHRCQALTKAGLPCKNRAGHNSTTCYVHGKTLQAGDLLEKEERRD